MWICPICKKEVDDSSIICPNCGSSKDDIPATPETVKESTPVEPEKKIITSGIDWIVTAYGIISVILFLATVIYFIMGLTSNYRGGIYIENAVMCLALGFTSLFTGYLVRAFSYIVRAAKIYLQKNGENIEES